jgi:hypothetical protein
MSTAMQETTDRVGPPSFHVAVASAVGSDAATEPMPGAATEGTASFGPRDPPEC